MPLPKQVHIGPLTYPIVTDRAVINQATVDSQVTFYCKADIFNATYEAIPANA